MFFIKLGNYWLNLDKVTHIQEVPNGDEVRYYVHFAYAANDSENNYIVLTGEEAKHLYYNLESQRRD
jgi:hypothetical protein